MGKADPARKGLRTGMSDAADGGKHRWANIVQVDRSSCQGSNFLRNLEILGRGLGEAGGFRSNCNDSALSEGGMLAGLAKVNKVKGRPELLVQRAASLWSPTVMPRAFACAAVPLSSSQA